MVPREREREARGYPMHPRKRGKPRRQTMIEIDSLLTLIAGARQVDGGGQNAVRIETWIDLQNADETPDEQAGSNQQQQSDRGFGHQEPTLCAILPAAAGHC